MEIVTGWLRRSYILDGHEGIRDEPDAYKRAETIIWLWNQHFPECSYYDFRKFLAEIASSQNAITLVRDWRKSDAEWIIPIDDDDWILEGVEQILTNVPEEVSLVGWTVRVANLLHEPHLFIDKLDYIKGAYSCGYAVRRSFLESLSSEQLSLIRDDHRNAHRYVHFSGRKYLFHPDKCFAQYIWTPASTSSIPSPDVKTLSFSTTDKYLCFAKQCESQGLHAVAKIAYKLAELAKKLRENVNVPQPRRSSVTK